MRSNLYNHLEDFLLLQVNGAKYSHERLEKSIPTIIHLSISIASDTADVERCKLLSSLIYSLFYIDFVVENHPNDISYYLDLFDESGQNDYDPFILNFRRNLQENPYYAPRNSFFTFMKNEFHSMLAAMVKENTAIYTNYSSYLESSTKTIGASFPLWGYFSTFSNEIESFHPSLLHDLQATLHQLSRTLRVANDISGYEREIGEGKTNAVVLWMQEYPVTAEEAKQSLWLTVQEEFKQLSNLLLLLPPLYCSPIQKSAEFVLKLYRNSDFHDTDWLIPSDQSCHRHKKGYQNQVPLKKPKRIKWTKILSCRSKVIHLR